MANNKKHHFVPQFYLKNFSVNGKSVSLFNRKTLRTVITAPIKTQCYRDYFYGKDLSLEKTLGILEGKIAHLLRSICTNLCIPSRSDEEYNGLMLYIAVQSSRTTYAADEMSQIRDLSSQDGYLKPLRDSEKPATAMVHVVRALAGFYSLSSKLLVNHTSEEFITSDNPCVYYNILAEKMNMGNGCHINSVGLIIILPISPQVSVVLYDERIYKLGGKSDQIIDMTNKTDVIELNKLQFVSSEQNVYFSALGFNALKYHQMSQRFYRKSKLNIHERQSKFDFNASRINIETGLNLTFLTLKKRAKQLIKSPNQKELDQGRDPNLVGEVLHLFECAYNGTLEGEAFNESFMDLAKRKGQQMLNKG